MVHVNKTANGRSGPKAAAFRLETGARQWRYTAPKVEKNRLSFPEENLRAVFEGPPTTDEQTWIRYFGPAVHRAE
jgi:hypothetical protein